MRLDFSNFWQLQTLGYAVMVGVLLCLSYDLLRFFNIIIKPSTALMVALDVVYWIYAAVVTFSFFMLFSKGVIRFYAFIGFAVGFCVCRITVSKLFMFILKCIEKLLKKLIALANKPLGVINKKIKAIKQKIKEKIIKTKKRLKKFKNFKKLDKKVVKKP